MILYQYQYRIMFTISSTEFNELPVLADKIKSVSHENPELDTIRTWCSERGYILHFSKTESSGVFYTLKYDRAKLTADQFSTVGRLRSIVFDDAGRICCVAPPKMLTLSDDMNTREVNSVSSTLTAEELVEGIMVNLFWKAGAGAGAGTSGGDDGKWYIATKSCVSEVSYDHILQAEAESQAAETTTSETAAAPDAPRVFQKLSVHEVLRRRICEVLYMLPGGLDHVSKEYCYSFVVQHPKNQIVNTITQPKLYLIAVYQLTPMEGTESVGVNVIRINRDIFSANFGGSVSHMPSTLSCVSDDGESVAATFTPHTVEDYCKMYASADTRSVSLPGVVFVDKETGFCYKKRNPKYESVKKRKGMEQKLMAQYLQLRKDHGIDEYLKYHPQHSRAFRQFRDRLHDYTQRLYDAYIEHYVKKDAKPLKEYDRELKTHMYKLHYDVYLATMKESGTFVTKHAVINYVNQLAAAQQLACLNAGNLSSAVTAATTTGTGTGTEAPRKPFHMRHKDKPTTDDRTGGFRSTKPSRGGRMVPTLSVQIPSMDASSDEQVKVKGAKLTGTVKVQNQFAGLDVD